MKYDALSSFSHLTRKAFSRKSKKANQANRRRTSRLAMQEQLEERAMLAGDAQVRFEYVDSSQQVVNALTVGESYVLRAFVEDIRTTPEGIFSAYLDFDYNASRITPTGSITHGSELAANASGNTNTAGVLDEVGGVDTDQFPGSRNPDGTPQNNPGDELFWFSVPFTADSTGTLTFSPNQAETANRRVLFFNTVSAVQVQDIMFVGTSVQVNPVAAPEVSIAPTNDGNEAGPTDGLFTVTQSVATGTDTVIGYTVSGTATEGTDYANLSGTVTIPANQTSATIPVSVISDNLIEADESVVITLNNTITSGDPSVSVSSTNNSATLNILDDEIGTVSIAATTNGNETGPVDGVFTVTQSAMSSTDTTIAYTVTGSATSGTDFTALSGTVTIAAGATSAPITVPVIDDSIAESLEDVIITLDVVTDGDTQITVASSPNNSASIDIVDNDTTTQVSIAPTRNGDEEGPVSGQFTVTLSAESSTDTVVSYTTGGTATAGADFTAPSGSVTIPAGSLTAVIDIPVIDDAQDEPTETITATLDAVTDGNSSISIDSANNSAQIDLLDNEAPTVRIDSTTDGNESGPVDGQFTVTLSATSSTDTVIDYTVSGTATSDSDFTALSGTVTIPMGDTTATIDVPVLTDDEVEGTETVAVTLDAVTAGSGDITIDATGNEAAIDILDDSAATVSVAGTTAGDEEGPVDLVFTVTQSATSNEDTVIEYTLSGDATAGDDYTAPSGTVTIPTGETSATVTIPVIDDIVAEASEQVTITLVTITSGSSAVSIDGTGNTTSLAIADNDSGEASIAVEVNASEAIDGSFTVMLDRPSSADTVINYTVTGSATSGEDFEALSGSVTIPAGETSATITLTAIPDGIVEGTETVIITFDTITGGNDQFSFPANTSATLELTDSDDATLSIAAGDNGNEEGPVDGTFVVTQSTESSTDTTVAYTVTGTATEGTDYSMLSGSVTIAAGETSATITVATLDDADIEGTETVVITLDSVTAGSDLVTIDSANDAATIDILDNEQALVSIAAGTDGDEEGPVDGTFTVTQDIVTDTDTVISYSMTGGTASEGFDFTALSGTVTITAGETSATIDVGVIDDMLVESSETLELTLDSIQSGSSDLSIDTSANLAMISIANNDSAQVSITSTVDGSETGPTDGQFTVTLTQASAFDTVVTYTVSGDATSGDDFTALSGTVTIPAGDTSAIVDLEVLDDQNVEDDESVVITLDMVTNDSDAVTIDTTADTGTITIADDADTALVSIAGTTNGSEEPLEDGQFTVTLSAASSTDTEVTYTISGTATEGDDFATLSGSVTIPAGSTSATIDVSVIDDTDVEGQETIILTLDTITAGDQDISIDTAADTAQIRISDNETPLVRVSAVAAGDEEQAVPGSFTISQTIVTQTDTTITYTISGTATEGDDFTTISRTAVIPAGQQSVEVEIPVIDDNLIEDPETVTLTIDSIDGDAQLEIDDVQQSRTLTIVDNDLATLGVTATADGNETGPVDGEFTFTLSQPSTTDTTVAFTVNGTATADEDFTAFDMSVTIPAGETTATVDVLVADDQLAEGDETVMVTLVSITDGQTAISLDDTALTATVIIADDDQATVSIATTADGNEAGPVDGELTVTQSLASETDTVIAYTVTGTATSGEDFTPLSGTVTIAAGETTATIPVQVLTDTMVEGTETVIVTLDELTSASDAVTLDTANNEATVEIADDAMAQVSIAATTDADEGTLTSGQFTVTLSAISETDTVVSYTVNGTATPDEDYAELTGTVTIAAGETSATIDVLIIDDFNIEETETVIVTLDSVTDGAGSITIDGSANEATVNITDDEVNNASVSLLALVDGQESDDMDMPVDGQFIVSLTNSSQTDTVISYTVSGTATADADFTALSGTVTIPAGELTAEINVPVLDDMLVEDNESVVVTLDAIDSGNAAITIDTDFNSDTVFIIDDADAATVSLTADNDAAEAGPVDGQFTVTLSEVSNTDTVVNYTVTGTATSGDDFTALTGSVTIVAGEITATITIETIDDDLLEETEQVTITLDNVDPGDADITIDSTAASATIDMTSDDMATVSIAATTDGNEAGPVDGLFTLTLGQPSDTDTVVSYTVTGTATSGDDFTALSGTVTIPADDTTATIDVGVIDDLLIEDDETVIVTLDAITAGSSLISLDDTADEATVNIVDNDNGLISIAPTTDGNEAGPVDGVFTVTQAGITDTDTVINYTVTGTATSGDDFTALSGTVTILAGETSATITVPVLDDTLIEVDETVIVTLDTIDSGSDQLSLDTANSEATITIDSDDTGVVSIAPGTNGNEDGPVDGTFVISLDGTAEVDVTVDYTVSGTATSGDDFTALSGTATIPAGQSSVTVTVPVIDDAEIEDEETVTLTLDSVTAGDLPVSISTTDDDATITIISENDAAQVSIAPGTDGNEDGPVDGTFTVTLSQASSTDTTVSYTVAGTATSGDDFAALSGTVTIPAGDTTATITVDVTDDMNVEGTETVQLTLDEVTAGSAQVTLDTANDIATIDLLDDEVSTDPTDPNTASVSFEEGTSTTLEADGTATVNVVLSIPSGGTLERDVTVNIAVAGGTATPTTDFTLTTMTVTFAAGSSDGDTQAVTLSIVDDTIDETSETVELSLSVPTSSALTIPVGQPDEHILTILDDSGSGIISGSVYVDGDKDGTRDDFEIGVPGITITLTGTGSGGQAINLTAMTDDDGNYSFTDLPGDTYTISQTRSTALHDFDNELGTIDGTEVGTIDDNTFTDIELEAGEQAIGFGFGEAGLQTPYANIRYLRALSDYTPMFRESVARAAELDGDDDQATAIRNAAVPSVVSSGLGTGSSTANGNSAGEGEGESASMAAAPARSAVVTPVREAVESSGELGDVDGDLVTRQSSLPTESESPEQPAATAPMRVQATVAPRPTSTSNAEQSRSTADQQSAPADFMGPVLPPNHLAALLASQSGDTTDEALTDSVFSGEDSWLEGEELDLEF